MSDTKALLGAHIDRYPHTYLAFSGGKDSSAIAHLVLPWRSKVTLVVVDTGMVAPHVAGYIHEWAEHYPVRVIHSHAVAVWDAFGPPTPLLAMQKGVHPRRLTPALCCDAVVSRPLRAFHEEHRDALHLDGVRMDDGHRFPGDDESLVTYLPDEGRSVAGFVEGGVHRLRPLWDWAEADVLDYLAESGVKLPMHYADGVTTSLDCLGCPAFLTKPRMAFLRRHYPDYAALVQEIAEESVGLVEKGLLSFKEALS